MKSIHNCFILSIVLLIGTGLQAQVSIGVNAGVSYSTSSYDLDEGQPELGLREEGFTPGLRLSIPVEITFNDRFALQTEANFIQMGTKLEYEYEEDNLNFVSFQGQNTLNYFQVPVLLKVKIGTGAFRTNFYAGPGLSFLSSGNSYSRADFTLMGQSFSEETEEDFDLENGVNRWELSALAGIGFELRSGPGAFCFDIRYQQGLTSLAKDTEIKIHNRGFSSALGYKITL